MGPQYADSQDGGNDGAQDFPGGKPFPPLQIGPQQEIAQIPSDHIKVQGPMLGKYQLIFRRDKGADGIEPQGEKDPQAHHVVPVAVGKSIHHFFQHGRDQVHGDKGVEEPVGNAGRSVKEMGKTGKSPRGVPPRHTVKKSHCGKGEKGDKDLGDALTEQQGQIGGLFLVQKQGPRHHEKEGHRRGGEAGEEVGKVPKGMIVQTSEGPRRHVEVDDSQHRAYPKQVIVISAFFHGDTCFLRMERGGA